MNRVALPFLIFLALLTGCAYYVPLSYHGAGSSATAKIAATEATMYLQHINNQYQLMVFDLEVSNNNSYPVNLSPEEISYFFSETRFSKKEFNEVEEGVSTIRLNKRKFAKSTSHVHELFRQKEKNRVTAGAIFTLISVGLVIYDEAKDRSDSKKQYGTEKDVKRAVARDALVATSLLAADIATKAGESAQNENYYLPFEIFTEGRIDSLGKKRGKIFLPMETPQKYLRIVIPFDNKQFVFDFKQKGT